MDALLISDLTSESSFIDPSVNKHEIKGTINSSVIQVGVIELAKTSSFFSLLVTNFNDVQLSIDNQLSQLDHPNFGIQNISSHIDINIKELETLIFSGKNSRGKKIAAAAAGPDPTFRGPDRRFCVPIFEKQASKTTSKMEDGVAESSDGTGFSGLENAFRKCARASQKSEHLPAG